MTWPDGGTTPYRGEKATNWEGAFRVPTLIRWPGTIKPGTVYSQMFCHEDFLPTFAAAAGEANVVEKMRTGYRIGERDYKVHLDGHDLGPFLRGETSDAPDQEFLYWSDDGDLFAIRVRDWKAVFMEGAEQGIAIWQRAFDTLRMPKLFNLRADPFERAESSIQYDAWQAQHMFMFVPAQAAVQKWIETFKDFPQRQRPARFNLDEVMRKLQQADSPSH
jgi:arylsulfatase